MDSPKHSIVNYAIPTLFLTGILYLCFWSSSFPYSQTTHYVGAPDELEEALTRASMANKTVIIAVVNKAYADQDIISDTTMLDLFLDSFWLGEDTQPLINHLLLVAVDQTAYDRCRFLGLNCYRLKTDGVDFAGEKLYMSEDFVKMMWRRTQFLLEVLKRGYSFIFTDTDVMWVRNPLTKLSKNEREDLQISTDKFYGKPFGKENFINTGFYFIKSNNRTIALFNKWYNSRLNSTGMKEQDVLHRLIHGGIIHKLNLRVRFLDTLFFSGFCQDSSDLRQVSTVHANCCRSIVAKIHDLRIVLQDWKKFKKISSYKRMANVTASFKWSPHIGCRNSWKQKKTNN